MQAARCSGGAVSGAQLDCWSPDFAIDSSKVDFLKAAAGAVFAGSTEVTNTCGVHVVSELAFVELDQAVWLMLVVLLRHELRKTPIRVRWAT